jgi:tRNA pseudouridine55 synthase
MSGVLHGLLVIDKPLGVTSRDAVDLVQSQLPRDTRIGHAGTLDPLATGVLVLCIGKATRLIEYVQAMQKTYRTVVQLGAWSATDDAEGPISPVANAPVPEAAAVAACVAAFIGEVEQLPPAFSAAKVSGQRAYKLARKGRDVDLEPRRIRIDAIRILAYEYPQLELEVLCGKGTYIRSLARDIGQRLGCGGYVASLRRTRIGGFTLDDAVNLDAGLQLLPLERAVADLPRATIAAEDARKLRQGQKIPWNAEFADGQHVAVFAAHSADTAALSPRPGMELIAVACTKESFLKPVKVLAECQREVTRDEGPVTRDEGPGTRDEGPGTTDQG